ncbi:MAG: hypothetical protein HYY96_00405 [Candidatus Tectomicrobia bacterium]|nr:hypothetical protein [Candidatus Tectomicrobia bacterium]
MRQFNRFVRVPLLALIATFLVASTPAAVAAQGDTLLYLVEFEATEAGAPTSREQAIHLLEQLIVPSLERLAKDAKVRAGGVLVGARAGVLILAAKSHDEVTELVRALPAWGVWGWKVRPLEGFAHRADIEKKVVQQLRAQKP